MTAPGHASYTPADTPPSMLTGASPAFAVHTLDEAAALLRVKRTWLERQAAGRKIPFTMLGGAYHFTAQHLATIVQIHEVTPSETASQPRRLRPRPQVQNPDFEPLRARPRTGPRRAA